MFANYLSYIFPSLRLVKIVKNGINITNSTNPLQVSMNITLTVLDCCAPPPARLAAHCLGAGAVIAASIATIRAESSETTFKVLSLNFAR